MMNTIDIIILVILLIGGLNGLRQGLVKAVANLIGWLLALILAAKYTTIFAPLMKIFSQDPVVQKITAFAFIVLIIVVLTWLVSGLINKILKKVKLGSLNRLAGGMFGSLKGLLLVLITLQGLGPWVESSPHWKQSKWVQTLLPYAPWATATSKEIAHDAIDEIKSSNSSSQSSADRTSRNSESSDESTKNPFY